MTHMELNNTGMKILLEEFVYGKEIANTKEEEEFIKSVLDSHKYEDLVQDLIDIHVIFDDDPAKFVSSNSRVFDFSSSYTRWRTSNSSDRLDDLPKENK